MKNKMTGKTSKKWQESKVLISLLSIALALLLGGVMIAFSGINPIAAYRELLIGAFGSRYSFGETLVRTSPFIFTGLSVMFARRCGMVNIGAEGQLYCGALGATLVSMYLSSLPTPIVVPLALIASFLFGGLCGGLAGYLKAKMGVNEIISTIMLNYIAMYFVSFLVSGPIQDPAGYNPQSPALAKSTYLPVFLSGTRLHLGFLVALLMVYLVYVLLWKKTEGYQLRVVGHNPKAAEYAGINVERKIIIGMFIAGGLAGLAGADQILGVQHRLIEYFSNRIGFTGIAVALLGQSTPLGTLLSAFFFGVLQNGSGMMQRSLGVHSTIIGVIQGTSVLFVVSALSFHYVKKHKLFKKKRTSTKIKPVNSKEGGD